MAVTAATWELNPKITFASLASEFKSNPTKAWRNYGSIVSQDIEAAIKDPDAVLRRVNPLQMVPYDPARLKFSEAFRGRRGVRYFVHVDLAKNRDRVGIGMVHRERNGHVVADFMWGLEAKPGQNIKFADVREQFIFPLTAHGFHIECITFDGFQSEETRQVLEERGYTTDYCSADRSMEPYDTLIELVLNDRFDCYSYPIFIKELSQLRLVNGLKYDHPRKFADGTRGTKDVADAVACAAFTAIRYELDNPATPAGVVHVHRQQAPSYERGAW